MVVLHQGHATAAVQAAPGLDDDTMRRHWQGYRDHGPETYLADHYGPYTTGKLTDQQTDQLAAHLDANLYLEVKPVSAYVGEQFDLRHSISGMRDLLHRPGFVYKHTKSVPRKADEVAQANFPSDTLPQLLTEVGQGAAEVYFASGCHPTQNKGTGRGWIRRDQDLEVDSNSGRERVKINAAVRAGKPEHLVYDLAGTISTPSTQRLCHELLVKHPRTMIYLICGNAAYNRRGWLQQWASRQRRKFVFLPNYSPKLNLIERLWKPLREEAINSIYYETYAAPYAGIIDFLFKAKAYRQELRSLMILNFRTVGKEFF